MSTNNDASFGLFTPASGSWADQNPEISYGTIDDLPSFETDATERTWTGRPSRYRQGLSPGGILGPTPSPELQAEAQLKMYGLIKLLRDTQRLVIPKEDSSSRLSPTAFIRLILLNYPDEPKLGIYVKGSTRDDNYIKVSEILVFDGVNEELDEYFEYFVVEANRRAFLLPGNQSGHGYHIYDKGEQYQYRGQHILINFRLDLDKDPEAE